MGNCFNRPSNPKMDTKRKGGESSDPDHVKPKRAKEINPLDPPSRTELEETTIAKENDSPPRLEIDETKQPKQNDPPFRPELDETKEVKENDLPSHSERDQTMKCMENDQLSRLKLSEPQKAQSNHELKLEENKRLHNPNLDETKKRKLNGLFEEIITKACIDYSKQEIQDIQKAVRTMLERVVTRVNKRGIFKIARIEPCGSMTEQTSVWKYNKDIWIREERFAEFDFLAVLDYSTKTENCYFCDACVGISDLPLFVDAMKKVLSKNVSKFCEDKTFARDRFYRLFWSEVNTCLGSACHCFSVELRTGFLPFGGFKYILAAESESEYRCDKCVVEMDTGILRVNPSVYIGPESDANCSLVFVWKSKENTLVVCDRLLKEKPEQLNTLSIHVDFLPALEVLKTDPGKAECVHDVFLVPKDCKVCDRNETWRKSNCMSETAYIVNEMSVKHRKCYKLIKYYLSIFVPSYFDMSYANSMNSPVHRINGYVLKTAILNHSRDCLDSSEAGVDCVVKILTELKDAFEAETLRSFHNSSVNVYPKRDKGSINEDKRFLQNVMERLYSITNTDTCSTIFQ